MEKINFAQMLADYMLETNCSAESAIEGLVEAFAEELEHAEVDAMEIVERENQNAREFASEYNEGRRGEY